LAGQLFVDFTSFTLLGLTLSGLYLWLWPRIRRPAAAPPMK